MEMSFLQIISLAMFLVMGGLGYMMWKRKQDEGED
jgi:LPXTG-motif cell wall-anchored protein